MSDYWAEVWQMVGYLKSIKIDLDNISSKIEKFIEKVVGHMEKKATEHD